MSLHVGGSKIAELHVDGAKIGEGWLWTGDEWVQVYLSALPGGDYEFPGTLYTKSDWIVLPLVEVGRSAPSVDGIITLPAGSWKSEIAFSASSWRSDYRMGMQVGESVIDGRKQPSGSGRGTDSFEFVTTGRTEVAFVTRRDTNRDRAFTDTVASIVRA